MLYANAGNHIRYIIQNYSNRAPNNFGFIVVLSNTILVSMVRSKPNVNTSWKEKVENNDNYILVFH